MLPNLTPTLVSPTLVANVWPEGRSRLLRGIVIAVLGTLLLTLSAKIKVPFWPVPMTMQPFVVLGLGLVLGSRLAVAAVLLYLAEGAVGLPVFADTPEKGIGIAYMMGPTGGYLVGHLLAAAFTGWLADRHWDRKIGTAFLAALGGLALIYIPGILWLGTVIGWSKPVLALGFWPFVLGDLTKAAIIALAVPAAWRLVQR
jgi:biotin transport system substrate-specific component